MLSLDGSGQEVDMSTSASCAASVQVRSEHAALLRILSLEFSHVEAAASRWQKLSANKRHRAMG